MAQLADFFLIALKTFWVCFRIPQLEFEDAPCVRRVRIYFCFPTASWNVFNGLVERCACFTYFIEDAQRRMIVKWHLDGVESMMCT